MSQGTAVHGPLRIIKPDNSTIDVIDENGNIDAPVTTTDLTTTGNTTLGNATTDTLAVNGNATVTGTATGNVIDVVATGTTSGKVIDISDLAAITTGKAIHVDATGVTQTDGILVHIDSASTALTATGRLALVDHTGNATVSGIIDEVKSAAADETVISQITASAALALGKALNVSVAAMTTGKAISVDNADALTTGGAVSVTSNSADTGTRSLVYVKNDHASATGATPLEIVNDSTLSPIKTTGAAISTNYFKVFTANGVTLWVGNGNTANGVLSGTAGDILLNGGTNKPEYCTGTTNWTALV